MGENPASKKTTSKPPKRPGNSGVPPPDNPHPFSAENQPSPEAKKAGWLKKKRAQDLAKAMLELTITGKKNDKLKKEAAEYFGIDPSEITVEVMLLFKQAQKAIEKSDTQAFNAFMDRAFGKPKEKLEHSGPEEGPIETTFIPSPQAVEFSKIPIALRKELLQHIRANKSEE